MLTYHNVLVVKKDKQGAKAKKPFRLPSPGKIKQGINAKFKGKERATISAPQPVKSIEVHDNNVNSVRQKQNRRSLKAQHDSVSSYTTDSSTNSNHSNHENGIPVVTVSEPKSPTQNSKDHGLKQTQRIPKVGKPQHKKDPLNHMNQNISRRMQMILELNNEDDQSSNSSGKTKKSSSSHHSTKKHKAPPKPPRRDMVFVVQLSCRSRTLGVTLGTARHEDVALWGQVVRGRGRTFQRSGDGQYVAIATVEPDGRVAADGRLKEGDELFEINGVTLEDCSLNKAR